MSRLVVLTTALVLLASACAGLLWWALADGRPTSAATPPGTAVERPVEHAPEARAEDRLAAELATEGRGTVREVLAGYWGADWERIEKELEQRELDLDADFEIRPWQDVAENFRDLFVLSDSFLEASRSSRIGWPLKLTAEWIAQEYPIVGQESSAIGPREVAEIESLCSEIQSRLQEHFDVWSATMSQAMDDCWNQGTFVRAPFATYGVPPFKKGRAFYAGSMSGNGWSVRLQLFHDDHPEIDALNRAMARLRHERDVQVVNYLKSL